MTMSADIQSNSHHFALEFFPDSITLDPKGVLGRRAAGTGLLEAALRPENGPPAAIAVSSPENSKALNEAIEHFDLDVGEIARIHLGDMAALRDIGCLLSMGPEIGELAWRRRLVDDNAFSIVGLTHTLCTDRTQAAINALLIDPVQPWDAIICTSHAGKSALLKIIDAYRGYLTAKGFTVPDPTLQLPVIPLGVHCAKFWPDERLSLRKSFRSRHALGENDTCVLCFGRLDPLTKAQPGPMIAAAHRAQARIGKNGTVQLFFVGQCDSPQVETDMRGRIAELAPDIGIHLLDGADAQISRACWHGADIFLAMSDNLQETFGLTVVEAMAAGLPVVAGDWSGYRDSVVNGETGTLVPTAMPGDDSHLGVYLADRYASKIDSFGMFVGNAAQTTSVDIDAAAAAIADLAAHRDLRAKMGEAGRRRANTLFDWRVVLPQYQELFSELASVRRSVSGVGSRDRLKTAALPSCANPYGLFAEYATRTIFDGTRFGPSKESCAQMAATLASKGMSAVGGHLRIGSDRLAEFMDHLNSSPSIEDLVKLMPDIERERVVSTCLWLAKYGLATISPERPNGLT